MECSELREWVENLMGNDSERGIWPDAVEFAGFIRRNWDFPGTDDEAEAIREIINEARS